MDEKLRQMAPREMADVKQLQDGLVLVINLFEQQLAVNEELREENRSLQDEINLLKGEHAHPKFGTPAKGSQPRPNTGPPKVKSGNGKNNKKGSSKKILLRSIRRRRSSPILRPCLLTLFLKNTGSTSNRIFVLSPLTPYTVWLSTILHWKGKLTVEKCPRIIGGSSVRASSC